MIVINTPREGKLHVYHRWLFFEWLIQANTKWLLLSVPLSPHRPQPLTEAIRNRAKAQTCEQRELHVWLPPPRGKPLSVTLSKVRNFQSVSMWQVQQLHWTESLINVGVISSSWHADNNMAEIGERQNIWEGKLSAQHVCQQTSARPWPQPRFSACLCWFSDCAHGCDAPDNVFRLCLRACLCESAREWSVARAIPQVSDIWSPGLIGPRRAWHSARTIVPQAHPIWLWSNGGRALCYRKLIRPARTTQVKKKKKRQGSY